VLGLHRLDAREAAEQCEATYVPEVAALLALDRLLETWPQDRRILWADESLTHAKTALEGQSRGGKWAILIGPEGGFSAREQASLRSMPQVLPIALGPRILRADTAAVAALTLWQATLGDWA
jgi:16S rRNA (uracil1498-N3)-methyltransferase